MFLQRLKIIQRLRIIVEKQRLEKIYGNICVFANNNCKIR